MTDKYQKIREALESGPVAWMINCANHTGQTSWRLSWSRSGAAVGKRLSGEANEKPIYEFDPDTIRELLDERDALRETLQALYDVQNGPPLEKHRCDWEEAMEKARNILQGGNHDNQ